MAEFIIGPHMRLQEWVAEEKGYFKDEGLDYKFVRRTSRPHKAAELGNDLKYGAYQTFEESRNTDVSSACHWTVNMAASNGHGRMWGDAYTVTLSGIFVPPGSDISNPEQLAGVPVTVRYQSGSHYSTIQALERFMDPDQVNLHFGGMLYHRLDLILDHKVAAGNAFSGPYYLLEQLGFRKILDTTFMSAAMVPDGVEAEEVEKYFSALKRAQHDIDVRPELYTHYYLKELPERYHDLADVRRWGPGERLVFERYTQETFEATQRWVNEHGIFSEENSGDRDYANAILTAAE